jgi:hypothetical protein
MAGMKRVLWVTVGVLLAWVAEGQNVQLHYDFGRALYGEEYGERPRLTSTVEMFRGDRWGSTFFFVDMDYGGAGVAGGSWEIARELRFWRLPWSLHLEYNGGSTTAFALANAYLGGLTYTYNSGDFGKGVSVMGLYKFIQGLEEPHNVQLTGTWFVHFGRKRLFSFSGFADWWRERSVVGDFVFLAEPQFWVHLHALEGIDDAFKLSLGGEVELSRGFGMRKGFFAIPTLGVKWSFD